VGITAQPPPAPPCAPRSPNPTSQITRTPCGHEPRPPVAVPGQAPGRLRFARSGLWVVHRGVWHGGSQGREGVVEGTGRIALYFKTVAFWRETPAITGLC